MHHYETFTQNDHIRRDENAVSTLEGQPVTQILKDSITEVVEAVAGQLDQPRNRQGSQDARSLLVRTKFQLDDIVR